MPLYCDLKRVKLETTCNRIKHMLIWKLIINSYLCRQHFIRFFDRASCHQSILILSALKLHKGVDIFIQIYMNTVILKLAIYRILRFFFLNKRNKLYSTLRHAFHNLRRNVLIWVIDKFRETKSHKTNALHKENTSLTQTQLFYWKTIQSS